MVQELRPLAGLSLPLWSDFRGPGVLVTTSFLSPTPKFMLTSY